MFHVLKTPDFGYKGSLISNHFLVAGCPISSKGSIMDSYTIQDDSLSKDQKLVEGHHEKLFFF